MDIRDLNISTRPKLSMVIPTYTLNKELEELTLRAIGSYRDQVDELIICEDGGMFSPHFLRLCDVYIYNQENVGFSKNVNRGWKYATGEYVAIVNSDTMLKKGGILDKLCIPGKVTSPKLLTQEWEADRVAGPFFVVPDNIAKERGYLLEELRTYCSDSEYSNRVYDIFQSVPSIEIYHEVQATCRVADVNIGGKELERDRAMLKKLQEEGKAA